MYGYYPYQSTQGIMPAREQAVPTMYYSPMPSYYSPYLTQRSAGNQKSSGMSLPVGSILQMFGPGSSSSAGVGTASASSAASGASSSGIPAGLSAAFSNPWTGVIAAAMAGATALSADSAAAGNGSNAEKWGGPVVNIPVKIAKGDWEGVMDDGAMGPVGAIYNIAQGEDVGKSIVNSLGPLGQVPYLLAQGILPFSGGKSSQSWIKALTGFGI